MQEGSTIHPLYIMITLLLGSITALFAGFIVAYLYSRVHSGQSAIQVPWLFYPNTILLISTSYLWRQVMGAYKNGKTKLFKLILWLILIITILFMISQLLAWRQMWQLNIELTTSTMASYLYMISGLHFLHVFGGLPFLTLFIKDVHNKLKEPVTVLLYLSDQKKQRHIKVLSFYWHYLDGLWIFLMIFFLINAWI